MSYKLSKEDIEFLKDTNNTNMDIKDRFGCGEIQGTRWRQKLGIEVQAGRKKGKSMPQLCVKKLKPCKICGAQHYNKDYCSRKCVSAAGLGTGPRPNTRGPRYHLRRDDVPKYRQFANEVHRLSEKTYQENIDKLNPEGHPRTLNGIDGGHQLDHITTVREGFDKGISPQELSQLNNLRIITWEENIGRYYREKRSS
tara:strand:- start:21 stop:611 length:591 start_codon:yes stop_codon:yes gene_type:complete